jgi:hypothetical protein
MNKFVNDLAIATAGIALCLSLSNGRAQIWTQTSAPTNSWRSIACSADGSKIVACAGYPSGDGLIYVSTNSGIDWLPMSAPVTNWIKVFSSADGTKLVGLANAAPSSSCWPFVSTNSGWTWAAANVPNWIEDEVALSADGTRMVTIDINYGGYFYSSTNSGATWSGSISVSGGFTITIGSAAEGSKLVAATLPFNNNGGIYTSKNFGTTWQPTDAPGRPWNRVSSSADGKVLLAGDLNETVFISTNAGNGWTQIAPLDPAWHLNAYLCSADGKKLVLLGSLTASFLQRLSLISTNSGVSWSEMSVPSTNGCSLTASADGAKLTAFDFSGRIFISQSVPSPALTVARSESLICLSWLIPSMDFKLQQSPNSAGTDWADVTNQPILNYTNLNYQLTLTPSSQAMFFRLAAHLRGQQTVE